ncbi:MAG: hypothetical protein ACEQSX_00390 [Baekduiaceae bacterium]
MDDAAKAQLKKHVTATAWTDYESSVVEDLGRAVVDWYEKCVAHPQRGRGIADLHDTITDLIDVWDRRFDEPLGVDEDVAHRPMKRLIVHCRMSIITGADWEADAVGDLIDRAEQIAWADRGGHDLVIYDGETWHAFDVVKPEPAPWGALQTWEPAP